MAKEYDPILCMMVDKATKVQDVAPVTQRYINTIVNESKTNAEKFVRQAEQDDEVPEKELKYVYKAYNDKFGYKFHDSASTLDKAIKAKDRLVKVPDNKLKEFEGILRSAGFKIVSKSDRGMTTHYQVEVDSPKKFSTEAELREWAKKIDAACDKMDATAPTTWNIGLTTNGKITAGLDVREMYVKDSASVLDSAISTCDAVEVETSRWSFSSGKSKPSGFGNWWFKIGSEEKNFPGNWSSAKAEAIKYAKEKGISRISLMT